MHSFPKLKLHMYVIRSVRIAKLFENVDKCVNQMLLVSVFKPLDICRKQNSFGILEIVFRFDSCGNQSLNGI